MEIQKLFGVKDKVVLVTGGSRGIGEWIAEGFVTNGAKVYICSRKKAACDKLAAELNGIGEKKGNGGSCYSIPSDLSNIKGIKHLVEELKKRESHLDVLINNAGVVWGADFDDFPESGWDKVMDLNLKSCFFLTQQLAPLLRESGKRGREGNPNWPTPAKVINITSIDGIYVTGNDTYSYPASKAGLIQLTRVLARRLAPENIHVTAIAPGAFGTEMNKIARDMSDIVKQAVPTHTIGEKFDMAGAALFLASRAGDYVVGSTLTVDGGVAFATTAGLPLPSSSL